MDNTQFEQCFRKKLIALFSYTIDFLNSHNLKWYVAYGTAIGAVRHKGLIPWDDDIDICMPREDYERFLDLKPELVDTDFDIISLRDESYYLYFGKIYDKTTSLWEVHRYPCNIGVYIDIFPMDSVIDDSQFENNYWNLKKIYLRYTRRLANINISDIFSLVKGFHIGTLKDTYSPIVKAHLARRNISVDDYNQKVKEFNNNGGDSFAVLASDYSFIEIYPKCWFDSYKEVPFENLTVRVPNGIDDYLKYLYGDYMTFPSEKDRTPHHGQYYINLKDRLTIKEMEERIKNGETRVC